MLFQGVFRFQVQRHNSNQEASSVNKWPDYVVTLQDKNFNKFIKKYPLSLVDFWAPWCAPCRVMAPRLRRLSRIYKGKVAFGKLNTQENESIAKKYGIVGIPHLMFFHHGKKITSIIGVRSISDIKDKIDDLLKKLVE